MAMTVSQHEANPASLFALAAFKVVAPLLGILKEEVTMTDLVQMYPDQMEQIATTTVLSQANVKTNVNR